MQINLKNNLYFFFKITLFTSFFFNNTPDATPINTPKQVFEGCDGIFKTRDDDYPLPTEMTFRKFSDHIIDCSTESFDPDIVKRGDTIFLADYYIPWFTRYVHPLISQPYILISNDTDNYHPDTGLWDYDEKNGWAPPVEATRTLLYDSKVAAWFCKNLIISRHPKLFQIPIGQNIVYWGPFTSKDTLLNLSTQKNQKKTHLLFLNISTHTHPVRKKLVEMFKDKPYCFSQQLEKRAYYQELANSDFTLAPPGLGPDTVRFWEAVILDTIPVVKHYELDDLYADMPVLFVHEWEEINEEYLLKKIPEIKTKKLSKEKAYFDYWLKKIRAIQNQVRNNNNSFSHIQATAFDAKELNSLFKVLKTHSSSKNKELLIKGSVMNLRPFEIAKKCKFLRKIYVQDPWGSFGHEKPFSYIEKYTDVSQLQNTEKMFPISFFDDPYPIIKPGNASVFFDLSYLKTKLPEELEKAYLNTGNGIVICGNCGLDPYVKEVLNLFMKKFNVKITTQSSIWFLEK